MLRSILSDDLPKSRWPALALVAILVGLAVAPFLFPGAKSLNVAAKICVFIVLAASFDLLLGYTGIVSFAHTMFFGIGAYGVAISLTRMGAGWDAVAVGVVAGLIVAIVLATVIGLFSLRVRTIFFAMITLAVRQRLRDPGLAALGPHGRRGRAELPAAGGPARILLLRRHAVRRAPERASCSTTISSTPRRWR